MELSERKQKILAIVVEHFIAKGEPVGSKFISSAFETNVSSATIRNEMAELSEMGYLEQPHTSAGRVPSQKGYRYYVDHLMDKYEITPSEQFRIGNMLKNSNREPERLLERANEILAEITGCAALTTTPLGNQTLIKRVEIVPIGARTAMIVLLTSSGVVKSRVCRIDSEITLEVVELFYTIAAAHFVGRKASEIHTASVQTIVASLGEKAFLMTPLLVELREMSAAAARAEVLLRGQSNLLNYREFEANAYELMEFLSRGEPLSRLLVSNRDELSVLIGRENFFREMENSSMILSSYKIGTEDAGSLGIIGPTRIDYARLIPSIRFISRIVSSILSETID